MSPRSEYGTETGSIRGTRVARHVQSHGAKQVDNAVVAIGHTILIIAYHLLADSSEYADLGPRYSDERDEQHVTSRLVHRLEALGYSVQLESSAASRRRRLFHRTQRGL